MQLRGGNIAFKNVLFDEPEIPVINLTKIQGRNQELNQRRNECLVDRYYFTGRLNSESNYEAIVNKVAAQFFLSPYYCSKVILNHTRQLTELKLTWKAEPVEKMQKHFARKWPHLVW